MLLAVWLNKRLDLGGWIAFRGVVCDRCNYSVGAIKSPKLATVTAQESEDSGCAPGSFVSTSEAYFLYVRRAKRTKMGCS